MPIAEVVEHVLLLKVKPEASEGEKDEMLEQLNSLKSITGVLHLRAGPALFHWPDDNALARGITHILHSRHQNKAALVQFALHPAHIYTMDKYVTPILEENALVAIDWVARVESFVDHIFRGKRIVICRLTYNASEAEKAQLALDISGASKSSSFPSAGPNFSHARCSGYNYGYLEFYKSVDELRDFANRPEGVATLLKDPRSCVHSFVLIDYENDTSKFPENSPIAELNKPRNT